MVAVEVVGVPLGVLMTVEACVSAWIVRRLRSSGWCGLV